MNRYLSRIELHDDRLDGWVIDQEAAGSVPSVRIDVDGKPFARLIAADAVDSRSLGIEEWPPALAARFRTKPQIPAGFEYRIPTSVPRGIPHVLEVFAVDQDRQTSIFRINSTFAESAVAGLRAVFSDFRFISIEEIEEREGEAALRGWCSLPQEIDRQLSLRINDAIVPLELSRIPSSPDSQHFTFWPDRPTYALSATVGLSAIAPGPRGYRIVAVDPAGQRFFPASQDCYLPTYWRDCLRWPIPALESIERVTPWVAQRAKRPAEPFVKMGFLLSGYSDIWHIEDQMQPATGRGMADIRTILDWGAGCGRLTQHLARLPAAKVYGADIDPDNVAWASANVRDGSFTAVNLDPPLPYPDGHFDMVIGISVFTHLTEADQFAWLAELRRVLKPDGVLAVTVAGDNALKKATLPAAIRFFSETRRHGFSDNTIGNTFDHLLKHRPAYYRNTRHQPDYIRREWSRYFDVRAIERGAMGGQQDLVIAVPLQK